MIDFKEFIGKQFWIFAVTYAKKSPHEYIVRGKNEGGYEEFMEAVDYIHENGITMHYWNYPNKYVFLGDYYYWTMNDANGVPVVINRAKVDDYKISVVWKGSLKKDVNNVQRE